MQTTQATVTIPRGARHRAQKAASRILKRTGLTLDWRVVLLLARLHKATLQVKRGLTQEEIVRLWNIPALQYDNLAQMMHAGVLQKTRGWATYKENGEVVSESEPVGLFSLSPRLAAFSLLWRNL